MQRVVCGGIGYPPHIFKRMTLREVINVIRGYRDRQKEEYQTSWEQARWIGFITVQPHTSKVKKPSQLLKFPWESKKKQIQGVNNDILIRQILGRKK